MKSFNKFSTKLRKIILYPFWINKYSLGRKKIFIFEVVFILLSLMFVENFFYLLLVNLLPVLFFGFLVFQFGLFILLERFYVNNKEFDIVYYFLPRDLQKSFKGIKYKFNFESKTPVFNRRKLLYFETLEDLLVENKFKNALIFGGGGGSIPLWLANNFKIKKVVVVEVSKKMISIAKKYFIKNRQNKIKFICADATKYLGISSKYDFIFLDVFDGCKIDRNILSSVFIKKLKKSTNDLLVINFGIIIKEKQNENIYLFFKIYKKIIPDLKIYICRHNFIGVYSNHFNNRYSMVDIGIRIL